MKSFRMLTVAAFAAATLPRLAQRGMFVDGVTYASIARNLSEGRGSFWSPSYTATIYPQFHEHPPFGFWLQSLWFRVLGDHLFVERAYSLAAALVTALLIARIWHRLQQSGAEGPAQACPERSSVDRPGLSETLIPRQAQDERRVEGLRTSGRRDGPHVPGASADEWLPVLFWILVPVVSWAIVGNLLETSLSLLTTAAVAAAVEAAFAARPTSTAAWGIVSGVCVVAAALTKGPVGLFPLAAPVMFWMIFGNRRAWASLVGQWSAVMLCAIALLSFEAPRASLAQYLDQQVFASLGGRREISAGSWTIVIQLVSGVWAPIVLAGGLIVAAAQRFVRPRQPQRAQAAALFLVGLAGTLPIAVSVKQAGHYLVPGVPLYALAAACLLAPTAAVLIERLAVRQHERFVNSLSAVVLLVAIGVAYVPALRRDAPRLADLDVLAAGVPRGATIGICPESNGDWGLHAWFERRFDVSLDAAGGPQREWFLATAAPRVGCPPVDCTPATDPNRQLVLMKCPRER